MTFYEFAGNHPWLTFFLCLLVLSCIEGCVKAVANAFAKHPVVDEVEKEKEDENTK